MIPMLISITRHQPVGQNEAGTEASAISPASAQDAGWGLDLSSMTYSRLFTRPTSWWSRSLFRVGQNPMHPVGPCRTGLGMGQGFEHQVRAVGLVSLRRAQLAV